MSIYLVFLMLCVFTLDQNKVGTCQDYQLFELLSQNWQGRKKTIYRFHNLKSLSKSAFLSCDLRSILALELATLIIPQNTIFHVNSHMVPLSKYLSSVLGLGSK